MQQEQGKGGAGESVEGGCAAGSGAYSSSSFMPWRLSLLANTHTHTRPSCCSPAPALSVLRALCVDNLLWQQRTCYAAKAREERQVEKQQCEEVAEEKDLFGCLTWLSRRFLNVISMHVCISLAQTRTHACINHVRCKIKYERKCLI